jgi:hypothetical protein
MQSKSRIEVARAEKVRGKVGFGRNLNSFCFRILILKSSTMNSKDNGDDEYLLFKKRLDQIYDLCTRCKKNLTAHLHNQDQQIGDYLLRQRSTKPLDSLNNNRRSKLSENSANGPSSKRLPLKPSKPTTSEHSDHRANDSNNNQTDSNKPENSTFYNNFFNCLHRKAYTIAGTVPAMMLKSAKSPLKSPKNNPMKQNYNAKNHQIAEKSLEEEKSTEESATIKSSPELNREENAKISCTCLGTVFKDLIILMCTVLVFACDLANLINDSDLWNDNLEASQSSSSSSYFTPDFLYLNVFLFIYKHVIAFLLVNFFISIHLAFKR